MFSQLRDLIYFDFNKAASLFSQVEGGLLKEMQESSEAGRSKKVAGGLDLKVIKSELSGDAQEKTSILTNGANAITS